MNTQEETRNILMRVRALVQQGWCQRTWAQDAAGNRVAAIEASACRWCLGGAIELALYETAPSNEELSLARVSHAFRFCVPPEHRKNIVGYNDLPTTTQQDVIAVLDRAIAEVGE